MLVLKKMHVFSMLPCNPQCRAVWVISIDQGVVASTLYVVRVTGKNWEAGGARPFKGMYCKQPRRPLIILTLRLQIAQCRSYLKTLGPNVSSIYRHGAPGL